MKLYFSAFLYVQQVTEYQTLQKGSIFLMFTEEANM